MDLSPGAGVMSLSWGFIYGLPFEIQTPDVIRNTVAIFSVLECARIARPSRHSVVHILGRFYKHIKYFPVITIKAEILRIS